MAREYYYYNDIETSRRNRRDLTPMHLLDGFAVILSAVVVIADIATLAVPHLHPSRFTSIPVLALAAQWLFAATVILTLYWIIRRHLRPAIVTGIFTLIGLFYTPLYYKTEIRRDYGNETYDRMALRVMTYNLRCFYSDDGERFTIDSVASFVRSFDPDIICFQEFLPPAGCSAAYIDSVMGGGYRTVTFDGTAAPAAIMSRFRILRSGRLPERGDTMLHGKALWADLLIENDTVRTFCVHLNGTSINNADADYIVNRRYVSDTARNSKFRDIVRRINVRTIDRAYHVDALAAALDTTRYAKILCGDFNDTPMSYAYKRLSDDMTDAFAECGRGYGYTFRGFYNTLRIDYALFESSRFEILSYSAPDSILLSDHLPVCTRVLLKPQVQPKH
ncbi:MAG: endonuclease/exonuclease/phosphatase family protein [Alistipes sp.]|nr:endonuclease/exonuclease/phosphatase family protein [Alistipes sp.]